MAKRLPSRRLSKRGSIKDERERQLAAWRDRATAAFDAMPHGARSKCATEIGTSPSRLGHVLHGRLKTRELVVAISKWLGIAPPPYEMSPVLTEFLAELEGMDPEEQIALLAAVRALRPKRPKTRQ